MRIVSWNIENMSRWLRGDDGFDLAAHVASALGGPDVLCLQEIRVRPRDHADVERLRSILPRYRAFFALCDDPLNVTYRGGRAYGVATFVHESLGEVQSAAPAWDHEGRIVVTALLGRALAVVNVYAVNGTSKPYRDPATGAVVGDRHQHKRAFQDRVFDVLAEADAAVAIGDWNVSQAKIDVTPRLRTEAPHAQARAELAAHCRRTGFVDAFRHLHPEARGYTWFARTGPGKLDAARVDFALVSEKLLGRVGRAVILDAPDQRPGSDHAPILIELAP